ncbi:hypothetical protein Naga_101445g2, partial [Nannochloropsis gaditana]
EAGMGEGDEFRRGGRAAGGGGERRGNSRQGGCWANEEEGGVGGGMEGEVEDHFVDNFEAVMSWEDAWSHACGLTTFASPRCDGTCQLGNIAVSGNRVTLTSPFSTSMCRSLPPHH